MARDTRVMFVPLVGAGPPACRVGRGIITFCGESHFAGHFAVKGRGVEPLPQVTAQGHGARS